MVAGAGVGGDNRATDRAASGPGSGRLVPENGAYTVGQMAKMLQVHPNTVRHHLKSGEIPGGKRVAGGGWRVAKVTFDRWLRTEAR